MYFDLNVPVPLPASLPQTRGQTSKKNKGKQPATQARQKSVVYSAAQISKLETRIDLLVRLGYKVIALNQVVTGKVDSKSHVNILDPLLSQLRRREGILFLKRLTIELDEDSEKGNGLSSGNAALFTSYDILALHPTTQTSLQNTCLTHTQPSPLTTHIISIPLTEPRLPFRLKHTLVRTAIKNGAVFEINYGDALHGGLQNASGGYDGDGTGDGRRNWWAAAREVVRVTKGKGVIVSGGVENDLFLRPPRDVGNLITLLGLAQNLAHDAATTTPKSLLLRAQTRKTYRAILSEPTLIMPTCQAPGNAPEEVNGSSAAATLPGKVEAGSQSELREEKGTLPPSADTDVDASVPHQENTASTEAEVMQDRTGKRGQQQNAKRSNGTKRPFGALEENGPVMNKEIMGDGGGERKRKKKKRGKVAEGNVS